MASSSSSAAAPPGQNGDCAVVAGEVRHRAPGGARRIHLHADIERKVALVHEITGERVPLASGHDWKLRFKDGWGFVVAPGAPTQWCSKLFLQERLGEQGGPHVHPVYKAGR